MACMLNSEGLRVKYAGIAATIELVHAKRMVNSSSPIKAKALKAPSNTK